MRPTPPRKHVPPTRYLAFLERSLRRDTQWAAFEANDETLWANVRRTVADFLYGQYEEGVLVGTKPELAYFVRCDRTTMTQNDLDNGRLICLVGVALVKPAEFEILRIVQQTATP